MEENRELLIKGMMSIPDKGAKASTTKIGDVSFEYESGVSGYYMDVEFDSAVRAKGFMSKDQQVLGQEVFDYLERCAFLEVDMYDFEDEDERVAEIISTRDKKKIEDNFEQFKRDVLRAVGSGIYNMELGCGVYATYLYDQYSMKHVIRLFHGEREFSHHEHRDNNMGMIAALVDLVNFLDHKNSDRLLDESDDNLLGYLNREVK